MLTFEQVMLRQGDFTLRADFTIPAGETTAIIGPSGAGKSTLLDLVAGFLRPDSGRILWQGRDITQDSPARRPASILFQDNNLFPHLSVLQNVGLGLRPDLRLSPAEQERVSASLGRVGLEGLENRKPAQLSGGQRGRVALARALLQAKPILLLDEPFAALGPALKAEMLQLVIGLTAAANTTLLMVTHNPDEAKAMARQTVLVSCGQAAAPVSTARLFNEPPPELRDYLG